MGLDRVVNAIVRKKFGIFLVHVWYFRYYWWVPVELAPQARVGFGEPSGGHAGTGKERAMKTLADRFRRWYEHERDCNAKIVQMLASVPAERRSAPEFEKALGRATHLITAREIWLGRLGHYAAAPGSWNTPTASLEDLPRRFETIERAWTEYLSRLDEAELSRVFEFGGSTA